MRLIVDSGSTKTDWIAIDDDGAITIVPERWDWNYDQETEQCDF